MNGINKVILVGFLGGDPEIRTSNGGSELATLSVAVGKSWRDKKTTERREHTEWIRVVIFNDNLVEVAKKFCKKGSKVYVEGEFRTRKWTDKDGIDRYMTEVVLTGFGSSLVTLDKMPKRDEAPVPDESDYGKQVAERGKAPPTVAGDLHDEVPF